MSVTRELPDVRFPELGLCRGHERLQGLAISNSTDDSGASWRPSVGDHSSVDRQGCTDDVGCLVRANEHDGICNFFGSADALVRNLCVEEIYFVFLRLRKAVEHSGFHRTRANDVDTNACAGEFDGRRLRDAFHGVLAADIHRRGWATDFAVRRRDVNDAAFALRKHSPNLVLHAQKHTKHICVEDGLIVLGGYIGSRTGSALGAGVIDSNVEATETGDGLVDEVLDFLFMPHIGAQKFGLSAELAQFSGQLLAFIVVSTGNNDPRSFMREGQGRGTTDAGECASDKYCGSVCSHELSLPTKERIISRALAHPVGLLRRYTLLAHSLDCSQISSARGR